ncbi:flagellar motor switch phosphatase FliY [Paludicola sp. MB14-C6]|uniref:flagellar motor switch phosphatase FliY n=1 Tax=Paludihabitans sp. MB14-C6 TaxID=3070656 RepID=UPI0027DB8F10|nr:flagellar motor switch phosphatase FliY [Paludicola sp. MB14-C6]WMJ24238.1 flagellar motor switch phosphatase FliY [Paludicola sp. MB14-C6]
MDTKTELFSPMEIDAIGEILNISLGSSATSVSGLLDRRVNITTPKVSVSTASEFKFDAFEPAIAVEINYISGLSGTNIMILKETDVQAIVGLLLGTDYSDQEFVMDEMSISAICEVMNQMMGAASTALSQFLNRTVNISTPTTFPIENADEFKRKYYKDNDELITVSFNLMIENMVNSEFISVLTVDLAKELLSLFNMEEPDLSGPTEPIPQPKPQPQPIAPPVSTPQQPTYTQQPAPQQPKPQPRPVQQKPRVVEQYVDVNMQPPSYEMFDEDTALTDNESNNLNMIMSIPLQITVEIGRTKKKIKEILEFTTGTIIELNKQAGTQVDVFVNGQAIAKGDVVVVDDYYGVRITEVSSNSEILKLL